jgi:predicted methyltransferase
MSDPENPFNGPDFDTQTQETIKAARAMLPRGVDTLESAQVLATIAVAEATLSLHTGLAALYRLLDDRLGN